MRFRKADAEGDHAHRMAPLGISGSLKQLLPPEQVLQWPYVRKQLKIGTDHDNPSISLILPHLGKTGFHLMHFFSETFEELREELSLKNQMAERREMPHTGAAACLPCRSRVRIKHLPPLPFYNF